MKGQYSLFDNAPVLRRRPCEYPFKRYIGQKVRDNNGEHIISEIHGFYTYYTDGLCGTPHNMHPVDQQEYLEAIETDIEYFENSLKTCTAVDGTKQMFQKNLDILYRLRKELTQIE